MKGKVEIYCLKDPLTSEVRYIGKANDSQKRFKNHLSNTTKYPVSIWIRELRLKHLIPVMEIIEITDEDNWEEAEIRLIREFKEKGFNLLNIAKGGNQPFCSIEVRANNGRATAKYVHSDEKRKRLWHLKQMLGFDLKFLDANGMKEKADYMRKELALRGIYFKTA